MPSTSKNKVIWLVILSILISFIKIFEIPPVIPTLVSDLNISYAQAGLFMSVYAVMKCLASSPAGVISDNTVRILWFTLTGGVVASIGILVLVMAQLSPWETALVISILTWGQTQAIVTVTSMASIIVPKHSAGKAIGIVFTLGYGGAILGTYLGGYLLTSTGNYDVSLIMFAIASALAGAIIFTVCQMISRNPPEHFATIEVV